MSSNKKTPYYYAVNHPDDNSATAMIKESYDCNANKDEFQMRNDEGYPMVFDNIYKNILRLDIDRFVPITISSDIATCVSTILALNEKHYDKQIQKSNYKVLIITDKHMNEHNVEHQNDNSFGLEHFIIPSVTNLIDDKIVKSNNDIYLNHSQIMMIGINDPTNDDIYDNGLIQSQIKHLTMKRMNQLGIDKVLKHVDTFLSSTDNPVIHVVFDLSIMDISVTPSVYRKKLDKNNSTTQNALTAIDAEKLLNHLKKHHICGVDVLGFNASYDSEENRASRVTAEFAKRIFIDVLEIKENKINIFTEDSRFLICRPADPVDIETDIGWYILRNINSELKNELLHHLELVYKIITIEIDCEEYLVTSTTMNEQNTRSYYNANSVYDMCLFPDEKKNMMFAMLNN